MGVSIYSIYCKILTLCVAMEDAGLDWRMMPLGRLENSQINEALAILGNNNIQYNNTIL